MSRCLTITLSVLGLLIFSPAVRAGVNEKVKEMQGPTDSKGFAMKAAESGLLEVKLSQLAQQKATSNDVKMLAKQLEQDHTTANNELMAIAQQKNITLPTQLQGECDEKYQAFQKLEGQAFDNAYVAAQVKDHLCAVMMFQSESRSGTDPEIKQWASKTLTALRQHTAHIGTVAQGLGFPIDALASGHGGDGARPAGSRIEGTNDSGGTNRNDSTNRNDRK